MDDLEVRQQVARFVGGEISADELEGWLEPAAWELDSEPGRTHAAHVLRLVAEHQNGDWTDDDLRAKLATMNRLYWFVQAPKLSWGAALDSVIRPRQSVAADRSRAMESA